MSARPTSLTEPQARLEELRSAAALNTARAAFWQSLAALVNTMTPHVAKLMAEALSRRGVK